MKKHEERTEAAGGDGMRTRSGGGGKGKLAVFIGSTPNIGTTVLSFATAMLLSARTEQSVGYICLQLKSSKIHRYLGWDDARNGLDQIRADLKAHSLKEGRLLPFCESIKEAPGLRLLFGSLQREQAEFFQPEDIIHLLDEARRTFDLTIVEVGAYWDNAATVTAMLEADERIAVTTPDLGHFQEDMNRGLKVMAHLYGLGPTAFVLAVNRKQPGRMAGGLGTADIRKETGMEIVSEIAVYPELLDAVNQGRLPAFIREQPGFRKQVEPIVFRLESIFGLTLRSQECKKLWIKRRIPDFSSS